MLLCTARQREEGQNIWGISTYQCCRYLFRVQSKSSLSGRPFQECMTAATWPSMASPRPWQFSTSWATTTPRHQQSHRGFHLLKYVANRGSIMTAMKYHLRSLSFKEKEEWLYKKHWYCQMRKSENRCTISPRHSDGEGTWLPFRRQAMTAHSRWEIGHSQSKW